MMNLITQDLFLKQLFEQLAVQEPDKSALYQFFTEKLFELAPIEEFLDEPIQDVCGYIRSLMSFMATFDGKEPGVRCFNPTLEEDGWEHRHTHIFVLQQDMAFLVDSIRMLVVRRRLTLYGVNSTVLNVVRDAEGNLLDLLPHSTEQSRKEALICFQIDRTSDSDKQKQITSDIRDLLFQVQVVNDDYRPSLELLNGVTNSLRLNRSAVAEDKLAESLAFLEWIKDNHFTFLAYSYYEISQEADPLIVHRSDGELGLFRIAARDIPAAHVSSLAPGFRGFYTSDALLTLTKSSVRSRIHRDSYCDYVVVKDFDADGHLVGEHRFLGLYTSLVYAQSPFTIPVLRQKLHKIYERSGLSPSGYDGKELRQIMEVHPREELLHGSEDELYETLIGIWQIQERRRVKLFLRADPFEKYVSCIVYFPKDSYRTEVREQTEKLLCETLDASESHFTTYFTESLLVRTHFMLRINSNRYQQVDRQALEKEIHLLTHDWRDELKSALVDHWGDEKGNSFAADYRDAFPASYRENFDPRAAVHDMALLLTLDTEDQLAMSFYQPPGAVHNLVRFKVFHLNKELLLSKMVPILENLGFLVVAEHPYAIKGHLKPVVWLHEFTLEFELDIPVDVPGVRDNFQSAFEAVWKQQAENDSFNWLVVGARLDWRSVSLLRLYGRYLKQLGFAISQEFIARTLCDNLDISRNLVALFKTKFDPRFSHGEDDQEKRATRLERKILDALDQVANLNQDQVMRTYLQLICSTVRTNFFQHTEDNNPKPCISIKLKPRDVVLVPEPRPEYEVFVYSPRVEGVHLRAGKVARGGIRWSDRIEDYRTEILGLVKAQQVKNAVIVPTGAKGGFVAKKLSQFTSRDDVQAEGIACYKLFISALLDVTDNLDSGEVIPPQDVVRHDGDDTYLVVAADKGTASFSDVANTISADYGHWLGDAFASGGSHGFDHKKMGITAKGAWVAVQRHFRELGLNTQTDEFTVLGVGDMSGDVFGNGMLLSPSIKLVAAFNHQSIFIDPNPDMQASFQERQRLFALSRSSWEDYSREMLSPGGGVYSRSLKSIKLSNEARQVLDIPDQPLTPNQLIRYLLKAPVDLIWNGGIGTYVKASHQSHMEVGDKANDELRVNGSELRCKVFGEGGNLGVTQAGRVEYALNGGACNTDFIDNAGGVDCSDQEVNIKIVLNQLVRNEDLTNKQRNQLLEEMIEDVADIVLHHNYRQTLGITLAQIKCQENFSEFLHCLVDWEAEGVLNRKLEFLPDDETLLDRQKKGKTLTRPELAVLVSYGKISFKQQLLKSNIIEDPYISRVLLQCFPAVMTDRFADAIADHPLKREIIANHLANDVADTMGLSFFHRQSKSTGADAGQIVRAFMVVREVLNLEQVWSEIENMDYQQTSQVQARLLLRIMRLGRRSTRWVIRNRRGFEDTAAQITQLKPLIQDMLGHSVDDYQEENPVTPVADSGEISEPSYLAMGLSPYSAILIDSANDLFFAFGMADVALQTGLSIDLVSHIYRVLEEKLQVEWFSRQIVTLPSATRWEDFARESFMDDLESLYRSLVISMIGDETTEEAIEKRIDYWQQEQASLYNRWQDVVKELGSVSQKNYAMFSVALRELQDLLDTTLIARSG